MVDSDEDELVIHSPNTPPPAHPEMQAVHSGDTADEPSTSFATNDASNAIELASNKETREEENFVASGVERTNGSDLDEWEKRASIISTMGHQPRLHRRRTIKLLILHAMVGN